MHAHTHTCTHAHTCKLTHTHTNSNEWPVCTHSLPGPLEHAVRNVADGQTGLRGHWSGHTPLLLRHHGHDRVGDLAAHGAVELPTAEGDGLCVWLVLSTHKATTEAESQTVPQVSNIGVSKKGCQQFPTVFTPSYAGLGAPKPTLYPSCVGQGALYPSCVGLGALYPSCVGLGALYPSCAGQGALYPSCVGLGALYPSCVGLDALYPSCVGVGALYPSCVGLGALYSSCVGLGALYPSCVGLDGLSPALPSTQVQPSAYLTL